MAIILKKNKSKNKDYKLHIIGVSELKKNANEIRINIYNDKKKNKERAEKIFFFYDLIIIELFKLLNTIQKKKQSKKFWEILVGPWLIKFIEFYYDKYLILKKIPKDITVLIPYKNSKDFPITFSDTWGQYVDIDFINTSLIEISKILKLTNIKEKKSSFHNYTNNYLSDLSKNNFNIYKRKLRNIFYFFKKKEKYKKKIINMNLPLNLESLEKISDKKNNLKDFLIHSILDANTKNNNINNLMRNKIFKVKSNNEFINLITKVILKKIPMEYFENFSVNYNHYKKYVIKYPSQILLVRSPLEPSGKIRYFSAIAYEINRTKIYGFQEGGNGKLYHQHNYELLNKIGCNNYVQWSQRKKFSTTKNFMCTKTFWLKDYNLKQNDKILIVLGSMRKTFFSYFEGNLPNFSSSQLHYTEEIIRNLDKNRLTIRFHKNFGYGEQKYLKKKYPSIKYSTREGNGYFFYDLLAEYGLKVFTSDYTANLQSLIINHPTIMLWDKNRLPNNPIYDDVYEYIYENNILFYDPVKCYKFIRKMSSFKDINNWWHSDKTQSARNNYLKIICKFTMNVERPFLELLK